MTFTNFLITIVFAAILIGLAVYLTHRNDEKYYMKKFNELKIGSKYFMLNTDTRLKTVIEIVAKNPETKEITVRNRGTEYTFSYKKFFNQVLVNDCGHYYEEIGNIHIDNEYASKYSHLIWKNLMKQFDAIPSFSIGANDVSDIVMNAILDALDGKRYPREWIAHSYDMNSEPNNNTTNGED
jgi:hypothetical protein